MALFLKGFGHYLKDGRFSDMTLIVEKKEYVVHRIILAYNSEFFDGLLQALHDRELEATNDGKFLPF